MAELPRVKRDNVSFLADLETETEIDPLNILNHSDVTELESSNTGVYGTLYTGDLPLRDVYFQVNENGHFIAWMPDIDRHNLNVGIRYDGSELQGKDPITGYYDFLANGPGQSGWAIDKYGGVSLQEDNLLAYTISELVEQTNATYSEPTIRNYAFEEATNYSVFFNQYGDGSHYDSITIPEDVDVYYATFVGYLRGETDSWGSDGWIEHDEQELININDRYYRMGALDLLDYYNNSIPRDQSLTLDIWFNKDSQAKIGTGFVGAWKSSSDDQISGYGNEITGNLGSPKQVTRDAGRYVSGRNKSWSFDDSPTPLYSGLVSNEGRLKKSEEYI